MVVEQLPAERISAPVTLHFHIDYLRPGWRLRKVLVAAADAAGLAVAAAAVTVAAAAATRHGEVVRAHVEPGQRAVLVRVNVLHFRHSPSMTGLGSRHRDFPVTMLCEPQKE